MWRRRGKEIIEASNQGCSLADDVALVAAQCHCGEWEQPCGNALDEVGERHDCGREREQWKRGAREEGERHHLPP
jgi:hypothetical protein